MNNIVKNIIKTATVISMILLSANVNAQVYKLREVHDFKYDPKFETTEALGDTLKHVYLGSGVTDCILSIDTLSGLINQYNTNLTQTYKIVKIVELGPWNTMYVVKNSDDLQFLIRVSTIDPNQPIIICTWQTGPFEMSGWLSPVEK
jgi:hypothetical protein